MNLSKFIADCQAASKRRLSSDDEKSSSDDDNNGDDFEFLEESIEEEEEEMEEPDLDCDIWDTDCRIIKTTPENPITGYHLMPTCSRDPTDNPKRIKIRPEINPKLVNQQFLNRFRDSWKNNEKFHDNEVELIVDPFKVCVIGDFLENANIFKDIRQEFYEIDWNVRCMDLYEFFQSRDLKTMPESSVLGTVYNFLKNDVMQWMAKLTGFELTSISATCSFYSNSDYLLVHDDQREDRKVAFVLYFTGDNKWDESKGGALQLFSKDESGQPFVPVRDVFPAHNQFVFFPVTNDSYHQVAEVLSLSDCRFSINGWFHVKKLPIYDQIAYTPHPDALFTDKLTPALEFDGELSSWLNEDYLKNKTAVHIQEYFEENSEICLKDFLKPESFDAVSQILKSDTIKWIQIGPPNRYTYQILDRTDIPCVLDRFLKLFQSKQMFELLEKLTDLELTKKTAGMKFELQKWTPGCYTLLSDYDWHKKKELDLIIHFGCKGISEVVGARTQYVVIDDEVQNALITIDPVENNLNIIYRDTARFTKYYSKQSLCSCFYTLICSYSEY